MNVLLVGNGGRILSVCSLGDNLEKAITNAYNSIKQVSFTGMDYRNDIGK
tara:strand:+ start:111 stop:260 length:150 start_codon:yes stop_codon:yes gene_type:complete